jgi:hypothetical protein
MYTGGVNAPQADATHVSAPLRRGAARALPVRSRGLGAIIRFPLDRMYYDDSARRLNLLSGFVFGTVLGAGLALLFTGDAVDEGRRVVVHAAGSLGRAALEGVDAARGRGRAARTVRERLADARARRAAAGDDDGHEPAVTRAKGLARRRFEL